MLPIFNALLLLFALFYVGCNWPSPLPAQTVLATGTESGSSESVEADVWRRTVDGWEKKPSWTPAYATTRPALHAAGLSICAAVLQALLSVGALIAFPLNKGIAVGSSGGKPSGPHLAPPRPAGRAPVQRLSTEQTRS